MTNLTKKMTVLLDKLYNLRSDESVVFVEIEKEREKVEKVKNTTFDKKNELQAKLSELTFLESTLFSKGERLRELLSAFNQDDYSSVFERLGIDFNPSELCETINTSLPGAISGVSAEKKETEEELTNVIEEFNNSAVRLEELSIMREKALRDREKLNNYFELALKSNINITRDSVTGLLENYGFDEEDQREAAKILMFPEDYLFDYEQLRKENPDEKEMAPLLSKKDKKEEKEEVEEKSEKSKKKSSGKSAESTKEKKSKSSKVEEAEPADEEVPVLEETSEEPVIIEEENEEEIKQQDEVESEEVQFQIPEVDSVLEGITSEEESKEENVLKKEEEIETENTDEVIEEVKEETLDEDLSKDPEVIEETTEVETLDDNVSKSEEETLDSPVPENIESLDEKGEPTPEESLETDEVVKEEAPVEELEPKDSKEKEESEKKEKKEDKKEEKPKKEKKEKGPVKEEVIPVFDDSVLSASDVGGDVVIAAEEEVDEDAELEKYPATKEGLVDLLGKIGMDYLDFNEENFNKLLSNMDGKLFKNNFELIKSLKMQKDFFGENAELLYDKDLELKLKKLTDVGKLPEDIYLNPKVLVKYSVEELENAINLLKESGLDPSNVPLIAY